MPKFVKLQNIPILETGTFSLSTGTTTFTEEDLADAVLAAQNDISVRTPRLKIGHVESGWQSGEPSFGNFSNLRLSENKQAILADLETYDWLADIMPVAFPNRSIEGDFNYTAPSGRLYRLAIHAVSLLGVEMPGVTTLEDLRELMEDPEVEVVAVAASKRPQVVIMAQVDAEDVRRAFFETIATGDRYFWFPRSMRLNPNELIAEDDESGQIYRVPFTVEGRDVKFKEPTPVYVEYVDEPDKEKEKTAASWSKAASGRRTKPKEVTMDPKELRKQLGLAEDATDEQVAAKIAELTTNREETPPPEQPPPPSEQPETPETPEQPGDPDPQRVETREPVGATASRGVVTVEAAAFAELQANARLGREAREQQIRARREEKVEKAIQAGKFAPARRDHFLRLMEADEEGTTSLINGLADNVIPVEASGSSGGDLDGHVDDHSSYPTEWLSDAERAAIAARG